MIAYIPDIREYLKRLECLVREQGDDTTANLLKKINESPDPFESLRKSLVRKASKKCSDREKWFQEWSNGRARSQAKFLAAVTKDWELEEEQINILLANAQIWIEHPYLFWYGPLPDKDVLTRCYNDSQRIREVVPLKEKVIAIIASEIIEEEQKDISEKGTKRIRPRHEGGRKSGNVTNALRQISENHCGQVDKRFTRWLQHSGLGGKKWQFLPHGIVMTLYQAKMKMFQEHGWDEIEKEALVAYTRTLRQMRGKDLFSKALCSVKQFYKSLKPTERPLLRSGNQNIEVPTCNLSSLHASETHRHVQSYVFDSNPNAAQITSPMTFQVDREPSDHNFAEQHTCPTINTSLSDHPISEIAACSDASSPTTDLTEDDGIRNFSPKRPRFDRGERGPSVYLREDQRHPGLDLQYDSENILPPLRVPGTNNMQQNEQAQENAQASSLPPVSSLLRPTLPTTPAVVGFDLGGMLPDGHTTPSARPIFNEPQNSYMDFDLDTMLLNGLLPSLPGYLPQSDFADFDLDDMLLYGAQHNFTDFPLDCMLPYTTDTNT